MVTPEPIIELSTGYWKSRAFLAAVDMGLFRELDNEGLPVDELATRMGLDAERLEPLVGAMEELQLVTHCPDTGDLRPTELAQIYLNPHSPADMSTSLRYAKEMFPLWENLESSLRREDRVGATPTKADTPTFLKGMDNRAMMLAPAVLPLLDVEPEQRVLDLAAGAGTWTWLLHSKGLLQTATLVEQEEICGAMERFLVDKGWAPTCIPGDYHNLQLEESFDRVLFFGALHQDALGDLPQVLESLWSYVAPGGKLWILDIFVGVEGGDDLFAWLFSLNMALTTDGLVHRLASVQDAAASLPGATLKTLPVPGPLPYALAEIERAST